MKKLPAPRGARDSLSAICVPPAHSGRSFSAHRGQAADFWRRGLWVCEVHLLCPPLRPAAGLSRPPNQHSTTCHACQQSSARLCRTMVMVQRVQPRPFRVWSKCGAQRQKPLLQYTATCRSGRATQHLLGSTTDLRCPAGYSSCPSRRGWGVRCPFCWPYIYTSESIAGRLTRGASPLHFGGRAAIACSTPRGSLHAPREMLRGARCSDREKHAGLLLRAGLLPNLTRRHTCTFHIS